MARDAFDYGGMMQRALRSVLKEALGEAAESGLPGEHHFYITFDTLHPGVVMPDWLRAQYPESISIVIQHEYWDLAVMPDRFSIGLSFSGRSAQMTVPFDAVTTFVDPHAEFGLKFEGQRDDDADDDDAPAPPAAAPKAGAGDDDGPDDDGPRGGGAAVVSLDRFRKS